MGKQGVNTFLCSKSAWTVAVMLCGVMSHSTAMADLDVKINRAILDATKHDNTRSEADTLFKSRCQTIASTVGFENDVTGRAREYSCRETGVGITLYAGNDLGKHPPEKIARLFRDRLAKHKVRSRVFIKKGHPYGSSMAFYINGESWLREPVQPSRGYEMIEALAAETNLILLKRILDGQSH